MQKDTNGITPKEFYKKVKCVYRKNQTPANHFDNSSGSEKVRRGRSHTTSSQCEDLLAFYIAANTKRFSCIHVDQPLTMNRSPERAKVFYPDISLVLEKEGGERTITDLLDLKTDVGWNRVGFSKFLSDKGESVKNIRDKSLSVSNSIKKQKERNKDVCDCAELKVSPDCNYHIVVITEENSFSKEDWGKHKNSAKDKGVYLYTLSSGLHPNGYTGLPKKGLHKKEDVHKEEFYLLINRLNRRSHE